MCYNYLPNFIKPAKLKSAATSLKYCIFSAVYSNHMLRIPCFKRSFIAGPVLVAKLYPYLDQLGHLSSGR